MNEYNAKSIELSLALLFALLERAANRIQELSGGDDPLAVEIYEYLGEKGATE